MKQEKGDEHDHSHKPAVDLSTMKESPPSPKKEDLPPPPPPPPPPKGKSMDVDSGEGLCRPHRPLKKLPRMMFIEGAPAQLPISETRLQRDGLRWVEYHGEDGSYYRGQVENDKAEGYGEYKNSGGDIYKGQWHEGEKHGEGKMKYVNGSYYHGEWESDVDMGMGRFFGAMDHGTPEVGKTTNYMDMDSFTGKMDVHTLANTRKANGLQLGHIILGTVENSLETCHRAIF